jgi:hypothetical protein
MTKLLLLTKYKANARARAGAACCHVLVLKIKTSRLFVRQKEQFLTTLQCERAG